LSERRYAHYGGRISELRAAIEALIGGALDPREAAAAAKKIAKGVQGISGELRSEREVKKEIAFFPYKASMWDSFESIWEAACADPRCFVSVVPIPYYDRDGAGRLAAPHYEGGLFPERVDVIPYGDFDMEAVSPDIAFIHNPYDGGNRVTSVHPDFYSRELKRNVGLLVYVPYYASDATPALAFAAPAADLAADLLIASSKEDAAAYARVGVKYAIAPLGSPKVDRIVNMGRDRPALPAGWEGLDGRKVFLLNTSVASMLRYGEAYFAKLRLMFSLFEGRGDIALLWRPHPLMQATIASMAPLLGPAYAELRGMVGRLGIGVVDHTPDMGAAIALSDAYIGDGSSSLVHLYALTGKPLFLMNFDMPLAPSQEELRALRASDTLTAPCFPHAGGGGGGVGGAYVFCGNVNALCRLDLETGRATRLSSVPGEKNITGLYGQPVGIGDGRLLLPPVRAEEWAIYDTAADSWEKRPVPPRFRPAVRNGARFATALETEGFAIFSPIHSTAFARYDKRTGGIEYHAGWHRDFAPHIFNEDLGLIGACSGPVGDSLFFTTPQGNIVVELDIQSMKTALHRVGPPGVRYAGIAYDGSRFWLTKYLLPGTFERQSGVVSWDMKSGECREHQLQPLTWDTSAPPLADFASICFWNGRVWVFPYGVNELFCIDPATGAATAVDTGLGYALGERESPYYAQAPGAATVFYARREGCLTAFSFYDCSLLHIDAATGGVRKAKIAVEGIAGLLEGRDAIPPYVYGESAFMTCGDYVEGVVSGAIPAFSDERASYHRGLNANGDGSCGRKVLEFAMGCAGRAGR
ncbi:MAG: hypothetical protein LBS32_01610, partial [Clostridiales Family XIII bacterium]|nr:hypothetical protein [Clostridiales Family XIII bacterium]